MAIKRALQTDDDDVYYYIRWRLKLEGETENMGVCTKERKGVTAAVLMATPCTHSLGGERGGQKHEGCGGAVLAGSTPPFLGRERAAVDVDVGPERRSPRYHETCLAVESVKESSAAVSKPRGVWLRMPVVKNLEEAHHERHIFFLVRFVSSKNFIQRGPCRMELGQEC